MARRNGGFVGQDGLDAPDPPTGVTVSGGIDGVASISFTAPSDVGTSAITGFVATSSTGFGATGTSSPISVSGLAIGTAATFRAYAINAYGTSAASGLSSEITPVGARGLFAGGYESGDNTIIDYITISTTGNATDFGDTSDTFYAGTAFASNTRGVIAGGQDSNRIEYVTIANTGNVTDFGDLSDTDGYLAGFSSSTRGVVAGGYSD